MSKQSDIMSLVRGSKISRRQRHWVYVTCVGIAIWCFGTISVASAQAPRLAPSAVQQMEALLAEKRARTPAQKKIGSHLLFEFKKGRGDPVMQSMPTPRTRVAVERDGTVLVDIRATVSQGLLRHIEGLGGTIVNHHKRYNAIRAFVPLTQLETLAQSQAIQFIRSASRPITRPINTTEGDVAHRANIARTKFGVDGSGVHVCAMSGSVDQLATLQASGDLPPGVMVLPDQSGNPDASEGTALLEIIHDLAPGADLSFATGKGGQAQMAQNILDLRAAGCDVIVDDIGYLDEGVFQDGPIAQAADTVTADGALYFSSAGNAGNLNDGTSGVWEGNYVPIVLSPGDYDSLHNFGSGADSNVITVDTDFAFVLQWNDPLGGSSNDYDLFLFDPGLTTVLAASIAVQDGSQNPFEGIDSRPPFNDTGNRLVVARFSGANRFIHLNTVRGQLGFATDGQISGHPAAEDVFAVAAVNVARAGGGAFTGGPGNPVETFSSDGPRQIFFNANGTPNSTVRQKPDIAAADGVATATVGFEFFLGTSASAPHAAGIAALITELAPSLSTAGARALFNSTALDIEATGFDRDSGAGILDANATVGAVIFSDGFESGDTSAWSN